MKWLPGNRQILFGTQSGDVQIIDLKSGTISKILIPHQRPVLALAVSKDGNFFASGGGDGIIRVWKISDWSVVEELVSSFGPVWSMDFSIDNRKIYYSGLDDYAVAWTISPRKFSDEIQGRFPRRFQKSRDMSPGELQFARKCSICHTLTPGDQNRAGPSLYGIFGRVAGTLENYKYSVGLTNSKIVWNEETIDQLFALGPQHVTPGSKMPLQKIDKKEKRDALIGFLKANTQ
jgi:cytochrome c